MTTTQQNQTAAAKPAHTVPPDMTAAQPTKPAAHPKVVTSTRTFASAASAQQPATPLPGLPQAEPPRPSLAPTEYANDIQAFLAGTKQPKSPLTKRLVENLKHKTTEHRGLAQQIQQVQTEQQQRLAALSKLEGAMENTAQLIWQTETDPELATDAPQG